MLIWKHQHIKNASGKQMNILLKPSPKILTHTKKMKSPWDKDSKQNHSVPRPCFFPGMNL